MRSNIAPISEMLANGDVRATARGGIKIILKNGKVRTFRAPAAVVGKPADLRDHLVRQGAMKTWQANEFCPDSAAQVLAGIVGRTITTGGITGRTNRTTLGASA